jgi:F-type H+/Na+-transporting ATPase subunit alpha
MANLNPAEISAILQRAARRNVKTEAELQEVGSVLQVGDGIARLYGLSKCAVRRAHRIRQRHPRHRPEPWRRTTWARYCSVPPRRHQGRFSTAKRTGQIASIKVGEGMLGRVVNTLGEPIDGKGPIAGDAL